MRESYDLSLGKALGSAGLSGSRWRAFLDHQYYLDKRRSGEASQYTEYLGRRWAL